MPDRPTMRREILLVFALSLGASAVYSIVSLGAKLTSGQPLRSSSASLNNSLAPGRPTLDLIYQLLSVGFTLVPVALAWHFLGVAGERASTVLGIDRSQPLRDLARGAALAAAVGGTGLGAYLLARHLGMNVSLVASGLPDVWWRIPVLVLQAAKNAILEEVLVVGYLLSRLDRLGWKPWRAVGVSAVLRGSYHLYQGFGAFLGNAAMGVLFGRLYQRWGRTTPLIIAHTLIDTVAFVGYVVLAPKVSWLR